MTINKDELATKRYGVRYERLSEFGKRDIDRAFETPSYSSTLPDRAEEITLRTALSKREAELQNTLQENEDLWEQLNEARAELEELRSRFNPPLSS